MCGSGCQAARWKDMGADAGNSWCLLVRLALLTFNLPNHSLVIFLFPLAASPSSPKALNHSPPRGPLMPHHSISFSPIPFPRPSFTPPSPRPPLLPAPHLTAPHLNISVSRSPPPSPTSLPHPSLPYPAASHPPSPTVFSHLQSPSLP